MGQSDFLFAVYCILSFARSGVDAKHDPAAAKRFSFHAPNHDPPTSGGWQRGSLVSGVGFHVTAVCVT